MSSEYAQFVMALVFLLAILIGSYWFVMIPSRREQKKREERHGSED